MCLSLSNKIIFLVFITMVTSETFSDSLSKFRILAPQFICPKDKEAVIQKPDNTIITIQTVDPNIHLEWSVRWTPLVKPKQWFTLMLWKVTRELEKQLNKAQPEPFVYIIKNSELLSGVNYIFNVTSVNSDGTAEQPKSFNIDNTQGDTKLMIEGRNDMLSIILVGGQTAYADAAFKIDAEVTTCFPTQDYYFVWSVVSVDSGRSVNVSHIQGSKLEVPPFSLEADSTYKINCKVIRQSNGDLITQTSLPFTVARRGLEVYLNVDYLIVSTNITFSIQSTVINHDHYDKNLTYHWEFSYQNGEFDLVEAVNETLLFPDGIPYIGKYVVTLKVSVEDQASVANATIAVVEHNLPIIQIDPMQRLLNEDSEVNLIANSSNVAPTCSLSWYFASENYLESVNGTAANNDTCDDSSCQHGDLQSDTVTIFSLEEQFLSELADYTNVTEWRLVTATMLARAGRARFVANCGCSLTFSCETLGLVYADIWFRVNEGPKPGDIMITPATGIGLETIFRISTLAAIDPDASLQYTFYCRVGDYEKLLLASYHEHRAVETYLPYFVNGTDVWVEVCDTFGACTKGETMRGILSPSGERMVDAILADVTAYVRRCELDLLRRAAVSAVVSYNNNEQTEALSKLSKGLQSELSKISETCISRYSQTYSDFLYQLARVGFDTSNLKKSKHRGAQWRSGRMFG